MQCFRNVSIWLILYIIICLPVCVSDRVVKFRRTGESTRSEDECGSREEALQVEGGRTDMESVSLADGAPVPREFANPTDGMIS